MGRARVSPPGTSIDERKAAAAERAVARVRDRRRFKGAPVPDGSAAKSLAVDHPAVVEGRTLFPNRVFEPVRGEAVLKDGASSSKIGGDVLVGRLRGARILTLTLEERATCPRSCAMWRSCYGSGMQFARRWAAGPALERRIVQELAAACRAGDPVLVRLHVLGDFYSEPYVDLWREALIRHPSLHVFGFTAWGPETTIGDAVAAVRECFPRRFAIRHSGRTGAWGAFTIDFPTERKAIGDAVVCPEQRSAMAGDGRQRHCGSCAVCWQTDRPIVFVEH